MFDTKAGRVAILIGTGRPHLGTTAHRPGMGRRSSSPPSGSLTPGRNPWPIGATRRQLTPWLSIAAPVLSGTIGGPLLWESGLLRPLEHHLKERDGIVNQVICDDAGGPIVSRLNLEQLYAGFDAYTGDSNPEFIKTQLMSAYQN